MGFGIEIHPLDLEAEIIGKKQPWRHIGIVVHAGEHDFITGSEPLAKAAREMEREARHVLPEDDLARR